jgi:hypothetical protein
VAIVQLSNFFENILGMYFIKRKHNLTLQQTQIDPS